MDTFTYWLYGTIVQISMSLLLLLLVVFRRKVQNLHWIRKL